MKQIRISLDEECIKKLTDQAKEKALSISSMGRSLLVEKLRETAPEGGLTKEHRQG